jgi:predicted transcriptional regulator
MATSARAMTLRLEEAEHEALLLRSQAEHTSMQLIARKAIREYLDRHPLDEAALQAHGRAIMKRYGAVMQRLAD